MRHTAQNSLYIAISVLVSLALHGIALQVADRLQIGVFSFSTDEPGSEPKRMRVSVVNPRDLVFRPRTTDTVDQGKTTAELQRELGERELEVKRVFEQYDLDLPPPPPRAQLTGLGGTVMAPDLPTPLPPTDPQVPRPPILEIDFQELPEDRLTLERHATPRLPRQESDAERMPSLIGGDGATPGTGEAVDVGMRLTLPSIPAPEVLLPTADTSASGTGAVIGDNDASSASGPGATTLLDPHTPLPDLPGLGTTGDPERTETVRQMDSILNVSAHVLPPTAGSGYFRVDISPNPGSDRLRAVPKDVLFLIDCSASISAAKLERFKAGVVDALSYLNPRDGFNVVSFRDRSEPLFADFAPVTPDTIREAVDHVKILTRGGLTDVQAGLEPFVGSDRPASRPLNIFLLTDGKSTVRNSLENEELIRKVVSLNRANVSIYTFSAGKKANLFLLDLLAYSNRGMSLHRETLEGFGPDLVQFVSTHSDLIVADLKYDITGDVEADLFPRRLPHLYRGETLSIYGRYPAGLEEAALSLVGRNAAGELEELVYRIDFRNAPRAPATLQVDWASQKVFHLIALNTLNPDPNLLDEVRSLAERFQLYVPYL